MGDETVAKGLIRNMKNIKRGSVLIISIFVLLSFTIIASALEVTSPLPDTNMTYNTTNITLIITNNETLDLLNYTLNNVTVVACTNCTNYTENITALEGNNTLSVVGIIGNETFMDTVNFTVIIPKEETVDFEISIIEPTSMIYNHSMIEVNVSTNMTVDSLSVRFDDDNYSVVCENCSYYNDSFNLSEDNHTFYVLGILGELEKEVIVDFEIDLEEAEVNDTETNETDDNETYDFRFDTGFEKLPQAVANDELSDHELAEIINNNNLNPGVINRLIKTGKLGNESITAILNMDFKPPGIFGKLFGFMGFKGNTYAAQIYENYNLSQGQEDTILETDDLPKKYRNEIKNKNKNRVVIDEDTVLNNLTIQTRGNSGKVPPGQAKKNWLFYSDNFYKRIFDTFLLMSSELTDIIIKGIHKLQGSEDEFTLLPSRFGYSFLVESDNYRGRIDLAKGITFYDVDSQNNPTRFRRISLLHEVEEYLKDYNINKDPLKTIKRALKEYANTND